MTLQHLPRFAIALAILIVGLAFAGVPANTLLIGLLVLVCPMMMMFMMGGAMRGDDESAPPSTKTDDRDQRPSGRR